MRHIKQALGLVRRGSRSYLLIGLFFLVRLTDIDVVFAIINEVCLHGLVERLAHLLMQSLGREFVFAFGNEFLQAQAVEVV